MTGRIQTAENRPDEALLIIVIFHVYDSTLIFDPRWCRNIAACCAQRSKFDTSHAQLVNRLERVSTPATSELVDSLSEMMNDSIQIQWIGNSDDHARTVEKKPLYAKYLASQNR